jgi:hypothetical protein
MNGGRPTQQRSMGWGSTCAPRNEAMSLIVCRRHDNRDWSGPGASDRRRGIMEELAYERRTPDAATQFAIIAVTAALAAVSFLRVTWRQGYGARPWRASRGMGWGSTCAPRNEAMSLQLQYHAAERQRLACRADVGVVADEPHLAAVGRLYRWSGKAGEAPTRVAGVAEAVAAIPDFQPEAALRSLDAT